MTYRITDEHHDIIKGIDTLEEAVDYAKDYGADVFNEDTGECEWTNPDLAIDPR